MKLYLCRHGETTGDVENRYGGDYDDHLTNNGKKQARELADKLAGKAIQKIFTSPRIRAVETAELINQKLDTGFEIIDQFRERNHYGILTGMKKEEAKEKYPDEAEAVKSYLTEARGGESYVSLGQRIDEGMKIILNSDWDTACLVTHGGPIRYIFRELLVMGEIKIEDCACSLLEISDTEIKIITLDGIVRV